ncbi:MAG: hypothetical protein AAF449_08520, partial [Myxococcota bacterium]
SGITAGRVAEVRERIDLNVFTPGSTTGTPINILGLLRAPPRFAQDSEEGQHTAVSAAVSGLMGLAGRKVDPVKDPAHVTLCRIVERAWRENVSLDLSSVVLQLVDPPFKKVGVFAVDQFFPPDDRMKLAMAFNAILAAPSFASWQQGIDFDPDILLERGPRSKVSLFNIAHLDDRRRQFLVSMLLSRLLAWSRRQPGTEDLRAVLFFDEVAGYLPPYPHNPPSKGPLLTLMKQARAVGLGVVVSTQNPVDLDYKALSNAGLWCIGRLSTPQDRERLLKGIEGSDLNETVSSLERRQFLLHEIGRDSPTVFGSRHAMCYLRGPLTSVEIGRLNALHGVDAWKVSTDNQPVEELEASSADALLPAAPTVSGLTAAVFDPRVAFAARFEGLFEREATPARADGRIVYRPALYAKLRLRFDEERVGFVLDEELVRLWYPLSAQGPGEPIEADVHSDDFLPEPSGPAWFEPLPDWIDEGKEVRRLRKSIVDDVYRTQTRGQFIHRGLKIYGRPNETEDAFKQRCREVIEERVDDRVAALRERYETKAERLDDKLSTKTAKLAELRGVAQSRKVEEAFNIGATIMSFFGGRRPRVTSVVTKRRQSAQAAHRVDRLEDEIERLKDDADELALALSDEIDKLRSKEEHRLDEIEVRPVDLEKNDIELAEFGVIWVPSTRRL